MNRVERLFFLLAGSLLAFACLLLLFRSNQALRQRAAAEAALQVQLSKTQAQVLALEAELADVKGQLLAARAGQAAGQTTLTEADLAALRAAGLHDPVGGLIASLEQRPDLIPVAGSRFAEPQRWSIIRNWVIALFSGDQGSGWLLLRYRVTGGSLEWTVLDTLAD